MLKARAGTACILRHSSLYYKVQEVLHNAQDIILPAAVDMVKEVMNQFAVIK